MKKILATLAAAFAFVTIGAGAAFANGPLATTDGSSAQYITASSSFKICDTDADGDWVYVKYHYTGSAGDTTIEYHGGSGCTTKPTGLAHGKSLTYKSCQNDAFADTCSGWKTTTS